MYKHMYIPSHVYTHSHASHTYMYTLTTTLLGVVTLLNDYTVCQQGDVLTPEQARLLVSLKRTWSPVAWRGCSQQHCVSTTRSNQCLHL